MSINNENQVQWGQGQDHDDLFVKFLKRALELGEMKKEESSIKVAIHTFEKQGLKFKVYQIDDLYWVTDEEIEIPNALLGKFSTTPFEAAHAIINECFGRGKTT